jgi:hypothetical protein
MLVGADNLVKWIKHNEFPWWKLYSGFSKSTLLASSGDDEKLTLDESLGKLEHVLSMISNGQYYIAIRPQASSTKNWIESKVEITDRGPMVAAAQVAMAGIGNLGAPTKSIEEQVREGIEKYQLEEKLKKLEADNLELKKQLSETSKDDPIPRLIGTLEPYLPMIMGAFLPKGAAPIAAVAGNKKEAKEPSADEEEKAIKALQDLQSVDENLSDTLTALAEFAKRNPEQYKTYIPLLKQM